MTPEERGKKYIQNFLGEPVPNTTESSEYSINLMEQKTVQLCEKLNSVSFSPKDWLKDVSLFVEDAVLIGYSIRPSLTLCSVWISTTVFLQT